VLSCKKVKTFVPPFLPSLTPVCITLA